VVALAATSSLAAAGRRGLGWVGGAALALAVGLAVRLVLGASGPGDRAATVMMVLLALGGWIVALLVNSPRGAFFALLGLVALLDLGALPARNPPAYDEREAFYRTDQVLSARVPVASGLGQGEPVVTVLVEPVFAGQSARFSLAGEIGDATLAWNCAFRRDLQRLALPVPAALLTAPGPLDVRLHLIGSPNRETDYLLVYASARRGGPLVSLTRASDAGPDATLCTIG
jgi:hypothetical protein